MSNKIVFNKAAGYYHLAKGKWEYELHDLSTPEGQNNLINFLGNYPLTTSKR